MTVVAKLCGSSRCGFAGVGGDFATIPVNALATLLFGVGAMIELPLPRVWDDDLMHAFEAWADESGLPPPVITGTSYDDTVVHFVARAGSPIKAQQIIDELVSQWNGMWRGAIEPDTVPVPVAAEVFHWLGYYDGPQTNDWSDDLSIALAQWGADLDTRPSVNPDVKGEGDRVKWAKFYPEGTWEALTSEYLTSIYAFDAGMPEGVSVGAPITVGEENVAPVIEPKPPVAAPAPQPTRYASMFGWGLLLIGIPVGLYYMFRKR